MDIKPDNILLGSDNLRSLDSSVIYLIDFGITKSYRDKEGKHIPWRNEIAFSGNVLFASKYCFNGVGKYFTLKLPFRIQQARRPHLPLLLPLLPAARQTRLARQDQQQRPPLFQEGRPHQEPPHR